MTHKLIFLTSSFPRFIGDHPGRFIQDLAVELSKNYQVEVIAPAHPGTIDLNFPFTIHRFHAQNPNYMEKLVYGAGILENIKKRPWLIGLVPSLLHSMSQCLKTHVNDNCIICSHWLIPAGYVAARIKNSHRFYHVAIAHGSDVHLLQNSVSRWLFFNDIKKGVDKFVAVSKNLKDKLEILHTTRKNQTITEDIDVIPMGIDIRRFADTSSVNRNDQAINILFMGRLIHIKGLDLLITALHNIPGIQLQIAGDGPERTRLERLAKCCRISHQFHSWVDFDKTLELLENADIVVVPSRIYPSGRSEGSPMIIMEAMASGCAVIASNTGGIKDVIIDGINGMLFPANNASALKMKLLLLIENSELRRRISYCARSDAQRFDVKHTAQAFKKIFQHFH